MPRLGTGGFKGSCVNRSRHISVPLGETVDEAIKQHDQNLQYKQSNLKFNIKKVRLRLPEVKYMGHWLSANSLQVYPEKVSAIANMPEPTDQKAI